jgi:hypothetical protein
LTVASHLQNTATIGSTIAGMVWLSLIHPTNRQLGPASADKNSGPVTANNGLFAPSSSGVSNGVDR